MSPLKFRNVVVAVSGGPDSVGLLAALHELVPDRISVLHVNHGLRGAAGEADEMFVRDLTAALGVPYRCVHADVQAASFGRNIEAIARRLRYDALVNTARELESDLIATGHTADDQAETVMHRMIRGTGLSGLAGVLPQLRVQGVKVIRPLLGVRRRELLGYLDARGLSYRTDETNRDVRFTRNRLRWEVMPLLEAMNPRVAKNLAQIAEMSLRYRGQESARATRWLASCELPRAGQICILDRSKVAALPAERQAVLWRHLWRRENWERLGMGRREWTRLARFVTEIETAVDLPGGIRARKLDRVLRVGPNA